MASTHRNHLRHIRRAVEVLDELKTATGCVDCGFSAWPEALHFDHIEPGTKTQRLGWARDRSKLTSSAKLQRYIDHVLAYCEVRCANCHARRTKIEQHWRWRGDQANRPDDQTLF